MSESRPDPHWTAGEPALADYFQVVDRVEAPDLWEQIEARYEVRHKAERAADEADRSKRGDTESGGSDGSDEVVLLTSTLSPGLGLGRGNPEDDTTVFRSDVVRPGLGDRLGRRHRMMAVAALVVTVVLGWTVLAMTGDDQGDSGSVNPDDSVSDDASADDLGAQPLDPDGLPISSTGCDVESGPSSAGSNLAFEPTGSPVELIEQAPLSVRGQIISALHIGGGGGVINIKVAELAGPQRLDQDPFYTLRVPVPPQDGWVGASFVAVLNGMDVPNREFPDQVVGLVHPEGFWLSCASDIPAVSAVFTPQSEEWNRYLASGRTLDELWNEVLYPDGGVTGALGPPATTDRGAHVYDLPLVDGGRLRLALPPSLAADYLVTQGRPPSPISIAGGGTTISIDFGPCAQDLLWESNLLGSEIPVERDRAQERSEVAACRPDQQLRTTIQSGIELSDADWQLIDVRTITVGSAQRDSLVSAGLEQSSCLDCPDTVPITFAESEVVIAPADRFEVAALDQDTLAEVWVFESAAPYTDLLTGEDHLYVAFDDGRVVRLAADDGSVTWLSTFDEGERDVLLSYGPDASLLVRSSFAALTGGAEDTLDRTGEQSDPRPPVLRRIDGETGRVLWRADGREGTVWQLSSPLVFNNLALLIDVNDAVVRDPLGGIHSTFDPTAAALAFDLDTGARRWMTDLRSRLAIRDRDLLAWFDVPAGRVLLARTVDGDVFRLDPDDGAIVWQAEAPAARFDGPDFADDGTLGVDLITPVGPVLLDTETGEVLRVPDPNEFVCPVTDPLATPFVPPDPWPDEPPGPDEVWFGTEELWTVVSVGDHVRRKNLYWSVDYGGASVEPQPELSLRFTRLAPNSGDAGAPVVIDIPAPGTAGVLEEENEFMANDLQPDLPGCWQVTASYRDAQLTYVYELN